MSLYSLPESRLTLRFIRHQSLFGNRLPRGRCCAGRDSSTRKAELASGASSVIQ
ncbi:unnamed protein product [Rhodiola kirilowii]